jgi:molybdopterin-guanine dinucleotide biosynthesis protein A
MINSVTAAARTGAIIAGGRARRLGGRDKSQLVVGGLPIIVRQVGLLQRVADEILVVGEHPERASLAGVRHCPDLVAGLGPIGGLHTALEAASADRVLVVACDLPFLEAGLLERLVELADTADAAWVRTASGVEPLVACYRKDVRRHVRAAIEAGRLKLADLAAVIDVAELTGADLLRFGDPARLLTNVNTPGDYERIQ